MISTIFLATSVTKKLDHNTCMYPLSQEKMEEVNTELEMRHSNPNHVPVDVQL